MYHEFLKKKIDQYAELKKQRIFIDSRLAELNQEIKKELMSTGFAVDNKTFSYKTEKYRAEIKVRDRVGYDNFILEDILWKKGLWEKCSKRVIDDDAVEQAYYAGSITDNDLRKAKNTKVSLALIVDPIDVQE